MKRFKVYVDTDWSPGGVALDLQSKGMATVYAEKGMSTWTEATLIIEPKVQKKPQPRANKKPVDK